MRGNSRGKTDLETLNQDYIVDTELSAQHYKRFKHHQTYLYERYGVH